MEKARDNRRGKEITRQYLDFLDQHIAAVLDGRAPEFLGLNEIAGRLAISHQHLTDTVKQELGNHPCHFYDEKIIGKAKQLLADPDLSIAEISLTLTYDPSNFSKFFKKMTGVTPGEFRETLQNK